MGDPHGIIIGEVGPEPVRDLLGAPRSRPAPVLAAAVTPANPMDVRAFNAGPIGLPHHTRQTVLHIAPQRLIHGELGGLQAPGAPIGVPLGRRRLVLQAPAAGRGVAPQLPRDRRSRTAGPPGDFPHPAPTRPQDRDLLPLGEGQVTPRHGAYGDRRHAASFAEPPRADRWRYAGTHCGISLGSPRASAAQKRCRSSRCATLGRPGDRIGNHPTASSQRRSCSRTATPQGRGVATTG